MRRPPVTRGAKRFFWVRSKLGEEMTRVLSCGVRARVSMCQSRRLAKPWWRTAAAFGVPVDPEVKMA